MKQELIDRLARDFSYHKPVGTQNDRYVEIRARARLLAEFICEYTPASREQSLAVTKLEEAVFWANAAIARNEAEVLPAP